MFEPFTLPGRVRFYPGPGRLPQCELTAPGGQAVVSLQGAQVLSYVPHGRTDLLWISPNALYEPGKAVRGGIPVCWPWFGDHPEGGDRPAHGFARNSLWEVRAGFAADETTTLQLGLTDSATTEKLWPTPFDLTLDIELGQTLKLVLTTCNKGLHNVTITEAMHCYFAVGDVEKIRIEGLAGCRYEDKLEDYAIKPQRGELIPTPPLDRVYGHAESGLKLIDPEQDRVIRIDKQAGDSTIVWNPGIEAAANLADMGADPSRHFICIEPGNARDRAITLIPEACHTLEVELSGRAIKS